MNENEEEKVSVKSRKQEPSASTASEPKIEKYAGYSDNISEMSYEKKTEEIQSRSFGQAAMNMYNDAGMNQPDDFFWKGHQQRKGEKHSEPNEQYEKPKQTSLPSSYQPEDKPSDHSVSEEAKIPKPVDKKALISELKELDLEISQLIDEIDNNFSLSKRDVQLKRKELHKVQARRNQINSMLAE